MYVCMCAHTYYIYTYIIFNYRYGYTYRYRNKYYRCRYSLLIWFRKESLGKNTPHQIRHQSPLEESFIPM